MKLGILSDTHGRVHLTRIAMGVLDAAGVQGIIHCGDVGSLEVLQEMAGRRCWFVWGNTDAPEPSWRAAIEGWGMSWPVGPLELTLEGKRIGVYHGNESGFAKAVEQALYDYLFYGHSHHCWDGRVKNMRVINPGALYRVRVPTVAVLDLADGEATFLELDGRRTSGQ